MGTGFYTAHNTCYTYTYVQPTICLLEATPRVDILTPVPTDKRKLLRSASRHCSRPQFTSLNVNTYKSYW